MSVSDAQLRSLLRPLQRALAQQRRANFDELCDPLFVNDSHGTASSSQPSALSLHFGPFLEAYKRLKGESSESDSVLAKTIGVLSPQLKDTINTLPFPCLSADLDEMIQSMMTVQKHLEDDKQFPGHPEFVDDVRRVAGVPVTQCLACDLCYGRMKDPHTSLPCMHSFCRECIRGALHGGTLEKTCPVTGCGAMEEGRFSPTKLGMFPFDLTNPTVVRDETLKNLIKNIFNEEETHAPPESYVPSKRPGDQHLVEDLGPIRCIQARSSLEHRHHEICASVESEINAGEETDYVTVAVFAQDEMHCEFEIEYNYFYVPGCLTVQQFQSHLGDRFELHDLQLYCNDIWITNGIYDDMTLIEVCDEFWIPFNDDEGESSSSVFTLRYQYSPVSGGDNSSI